MSSFDTGGINYTVRNTGKPEGRLIDDRKIDARKFTKEIPEQTLGSMIGPLLKGKAKPKVTNVA